MKLSYAGGTQEQTYSTTLETEKTTTIAEGCYANLAILFGADGGLIPVSAYEGVTADYEYLNNRSIFRFKDVNSFRIYLSACFFPYLISN